jgi:hypothetical protein
MSSSGWLAVFSLRIAGCVGPWPRLAGSGCHMFRGMAPLRGAAASFANRVVAATMSSGARRCGNDVVGAGPAVSWSGLCGPASPCDHTFSVAWMTSRRTGGVVAQLARPALRGPGCPTIRTAGRGGRIPAGGARVTRARNAAARLVGPVPRDRVTPPCCGRGRVTPSFSYRFAGGGDGTGSSTGHTGHRSTAASILRRRAELIRPPLPGPVYPRPGVRCGSVPRNASRLPPAPRSGSIGASGSVLCTRVHITLPEARILPADDALVDERGTMCR